MCQNRFLIHLSVDRMELLTIPNVTFVEVHVFQRPMYQLLGKVFVTSVKMSIASMVHLVTGVVAYVQRIVQVYKNQFAVVMDKPIRMSVT